MQFFYGVILGVLVSGLAWKAGSLSNSGAIAAAVSGSLIFGLGGLPWAALLLSFFITSSALSRFYKRRKHAVSEKFSKGDRRDWAQVFANGGLATLLVAVTAWPDLPPALLGGLWVAAAGALATANADTWATELGVLNPQRPRLITNWQKVEPGTSGGISGYGSFASLAGALLIGLVALLFPVAEASLGLLLAITLGGASGSLFDSLLGATVQAIYYCPACQKETERSPQHTCGQATEPLRGWRWLDNDWVNFSASVVGALVTLAVWSWLA